MPDPDNVRDVLAVIGLYEDDDDACNNAGGCIYSIRGAPSIELLPLLGAEALHGDVDRSLGVAGTVDVAMKRAIERHEVRVQQTAGLVDRMFTHEHHAIHAPEDAPVGGLGQDDVLGIRLVEDVWWEALTEQLAPDEDGDERAGCTQIGRGDICLEDRKQHRAVSEQQALAPIEP